MLLDNCSSVRAAGPMQRSRLLRAALVLFILCGAVPAGTDAQQPAKEDAKPASPAFEVAAIKAHKGDDGDHSVDSTSDRLSIGNYTLRALIRIAYDLKSDKQVSGGPDWMDKLAFDIAAKLDDSEVAKIKSMKRDERQHERDLLLQSLLAERFQLQVHMVQQEMPIYALVVAKSGSRLTQSTKAGQGYHVSTHNGHMVATGTSMDVFADQLTGMSESGDRVVRNRTGLEGDYDFKLDWSPDYGRGIPDDAVDPVLFTALQEQLGLKIESQKGPVEVVVVDSASKPVLD